MSDRTPLPLWWTLLQAIAWAIFRDEEWVRAVDPEFRGDSIDVLWIDDRDIVERRAIAGLDAMRRLRIDHWTKNAPHVADRAKKKWRRAAVQFALRYEPVRKPLPLSGPLRWDNLMADSSLMPDLIRFMTFTQAKDGLLAALKTGHIRCSTADREAVSPRELRLTNMVLSLTGPPQLFSGSTKPSVGTPLHNPLFPAEDLRAHWPAPQRPAAIVPLENEPSAFVTQLQVIDWIERTRCADLSSADAGPGKSTAEKAAEEIYRLMLQKGDLVARGKKLSTGLGYDEKFPAEFWIDAVIDRSWVYRPHPKLPHHPNVQHGGWEVRLSKDDVLRVLPIEGAPPAYNTLRPVPPAELTRFMKTLSPPPSQQDAWQRAIAAFPGRHVPRRSAFAAFKEAYPNLGERRGRRQP